MCSLSGRKERIEGARRGRLHETPIRVRVLGGGHRPRIHGRRRFGRVQYSRDTCRLSARKRCRCPRSSTDCQDNTSRRSSTCRRARSGTSHSLGCRARRTHRRHTTCTPRRRRHMSSRYCPWCTRFRRSSLEHSWLGCTSCRRRTRRPPAMARMSGSCRADNSDRALRATRTRAAGDRRRSASGRDSSRCTSIRCM